MNSIMTINIRVVGRQAIAQLNQVQNGINGINRAAGNTKGLAGLMNLISGNALSRAGRSMSQMGRQLTYGFTLPFVAAGIAVTKANLNIQRSMTQVIKVYGNLSYSQDRIKAETDALAISFDMLSERFGVHKEEVIDVAAAWASAGSAGVGLAKNTMSTLEAMILGDLDAAKATESLIAIQAQWGLSTQVTAGHVSEFTAALALLNITENETGITFAGLIDVLARSSGAWRSAGGTLRELVAVSAAMVPAAGSASQAGNAIKTMTSRLIKPTKQAAEALKAIGITVASPEWMGATVTEKILQMAKAFENTNAGMDEVTRSERGLVIATALGAWQVNRFDILMQDLAKTDGYFAKSMNATRAVDEFGNAVEATSEAAQANVIYQRELQAVLQSNPKKWDIMTNAIRNQLTNALLPLMPVLMSLLDLLRKLAIWFANLDPQTRKWIIIGALVLAVIGPVAQLIGAFMTLGGAIVGVGNVIAVIINTVILGGIWGLVKGIGEAVGWISVQLAKGVAGWALTLGLPIWAVVAIIAAAVTAILLILNTDLEDNVWDILKRVGGFFWGFAKTIANAFMAIVHFVQMVVGWLVESLSNLNPFKRHSPSLVDNVTAGVTEILSQYKRLQNIPSMIRTATEALDNFKSVAGPNGMSLREAQLGQTRDEIVKSNPKAAGASNALVSSILGLEAILPDLERAVAGQEAVVDNWTAALKQADAELDVMKASLSVTQDLYDSLGQQIGDAESAIKDFAGAPLVGMREMEDQIFANTHAQNLLNLELLKFEKEGITIDGIRDKYAALNGEIEMIRGEQKNLRMAGAGSDVLARYDAEIAALEDQKKGLKDQERTITDITKQLDKLGLEARFLELTKAITFDPQRRQLEKIADTAKELTFDEAVAGIRTQQQLLLKLKPQYEAIGLELEQQKADVEAAQRSRDNISLKLDEEREKLDQLSTTYSAVKDTISDMDSALSEMNSLLKANNEEATYFQTLLDAAALSDFDVAPGDFILGPEGGQKEIDDWNAWMTGEIEKMRDELGTIDLLGAVKEKWHQGIEFMKEKWHEFQDWMGHLWDDVKDISADVWDWLSRNIYDPIVRLGGDLTQWGNNITNFFSGLWDSFYAAVLRLGTNLTNWGRNIQDFFKNLWGDVSGFAADVWNWLYGNILAPFGRAFKDLYDSMMAFFRWIGDAWNATTGFADRVWDWVYGNVTSVVAKAFEYLRDSLGNIWDDIKDAAITGLNGLIGVYNKLAGFVNNVTDFVGLGRPMPIITPIPQVDAKKGKDTNFGGGTFAKGGIVEGTIGPMGGRVAGARALVGEGSKIWPEYVIPTDPKYRGRATSLLNDVGKRIRAFQDGGVVGDIADYEDWGSKLPTPYGTAKVGGGFDPIGAIASGFNSVIGVATQLLQKVVIGPVWKPIESAARGIIDKIPMDMLRNAGTSMLTMIGNWVTGAEQAKAGAGEFGTPGAIDYTGGDQGREAAHAGAGSWRVIPPMLERLGIPFKILSTYRPGAMTRFSNKPSWHGLDRAIDLGDPAAGAAWQTRYNPNTLKAINNAIYAQFKPRLHELIYGGPGRTNVSNGVDHEYGNLYLREHMNHVHAALAAGGSFEVPRRPGGTMYHLRMGEGAHREEVRVRPLNGSSSDEGRHINIYGDLSFPNISSGADAETFLANLESLATKRSN